MAVLDALHWLSVLLISSTKDAVMLHGWNIVMLNDCDSSMLNDCDSVINMTVILLSTRIQWCSQMIVTVLST